MAGETPYEATQAFLGPLQRALSCLGSAKISVPSRGRHVLDKTHAWTINRDQGMALGGSLHFAARMKYRIIEEDDEIRGPYRVTTEAYDYALKKKHETVFMLHWHPGGVSSVAWPHIHLGGVILAADAPLASSHHLATPRMSFEQAVRWTIECGAEPQADDWHDRLTVTETSFVLWRSWHREPEETQPKG